MKTLVLGIGNPILGDDGIGVHVAEELAKKIRDENIDIKDVSFDGLNLLELIMGYDKLIVIDAIMTEDEEIGNIYRFKPEGISKPTQSAIAPHHFNLVSTIEIGEKLFPNEMPKEIVVFAAGIQEVIIVTEKMTDKTKESTSRLVGFVLEELRSTK